MKQRIITAAIAIPIVLAAVLCTNPWPLMALLAVVGLLALREFCRLLDSTIWPVFWVLSLGILWAGSSSIILGRGSPLWEAVGLGLSVASGVAALLVLRDPRWKWIRLLVGALWIAAPLRALLELHGLAYSPAAPVSWSWHSPMLMAILPIWAGDTAAIGVGKAFGRRPLAPAISPNKTWEGAAGGFVASILVASVIAAPLGFRLEQGLACGLVCGFLGPTGDLFESWLKRQAGRKDSGSLFPGHGGVLDRLDSILLPVVPVYAILALWR